MLKTTSKFQGVLKMFMLGMLKTVLKTVEIRKNHHHTLQCVLKLSGRGPKIRWQTARFDSEFTHVSEVRYMLQAIIWDSTPYQTVNLQVSHNFLVFYIATLQHHKVNKKKIFNVKSGKFLVT